MSLHPAGTVIEDDRGDRRILTTYDPGDDSYAALDNFGAAQGRINKMWIEGDLITTGELSDDKPWRVVGRPDWRPDELERHTRAEALGWAVNSFQNVLAVDGKPDTDTFIARATAFHGFLIGGKS